MMPQFADTFFFIALLQPHDEAHDRAVAASRAIKSRLLTTRWVLAELADGFAGGPDRAAVAAFIRGLLAHPANTVVPATDEWFVKGLTLYESRPDKSWSLTDCISFAVMREFGLSEALTGDRHFEQAGFTALLRQDLP